MQVTYTSSSSASVFVVVLAGGHGERFWPLSRRAKPKHHLALFSERTLLCSTLDRLVGFVPPERTLVLTGCDQAEAVRSMLPELPPENIVVEPLRRDTAAAMALAAGMIARRDGAATVVVLPADHHIPNVLDFQRTLHAAVRAAEANAAVVTVAIKPEWACPGFGYLELGDALEQEGAAVYPVLRFHEKPSSETASAYLARGNFRWNAGMFVWTVPVLQDALRRTAPELSSFCEGLKQAADAQEFLSTHFAAVPRVSFDYAVMEKLSGALAVEAEFAWDDLGSWAAAGKYFPVDAHGNAGNTPILSVDARNNIVFSTDPTQHVALLGVENLVVVNTGDALLVCPRDQAERLKELVAGLPPALQ